MKVSKLSVNDADEMFEILQHESIYKYISKGGPPPSLEKFRSEYRIIESGHSLDGKYKMQKWIVRDDLNNAIGFLELYFFSPHRADFAYVFTPSAWGKGYAFRSCTSLFSFLDYGELESIYATVDPENNRSISLLLKLGFKEIDTAEYNHDILEEGDMVFKKTIIR